MALLQTKVYVKSYLTAAASKFLVGRNLISKYRQGSSLRISNVTTKVERKEALYACSNSSINKDALAWQSRRSNS